MKTQETTKRLMRTGAIMLPFFIFGFSAFSRGVRKEIGRRDKWTCQCCGKRFQDGWLVDASHFDHSHQSPYYNSPDNGQIECLTCHAINHIGLLQQEHTSYNYNSLSAICTRIMQRGLRTQDYYSQYPEQLELDRQAFVSTVERYNIDVWDFVDIDELE